MLTDPVAHGQLQPVNDLPASEVFHWGPLQLVRL